MKKSSESIKEKDAVRSKLDVVQLLYQQVCVTVTLCSGGCGRKTTKQCPSLRTTTTELADVSLLEPIGTVLALRFGLEIMRSEKAGMIRHRVFEIFFSGEVLGLD